jgi:soluble lytic murein transglycosylase-like protein
MTHESRLQHGTPIDEHDRKRLDPAVLPGLARPDGIEPVLLDRRRNVEDRRTENRGNDRRKGVRAFLHRFRKPIVGLGLFGAAVPAANARLRTTGPDTRSATRATAASTVDPVALAAEQKALQRHAMVSHAINRYDIERDMAEDIYDIAHQEGVEPGIAYGLVKTESTFRERAVSSVGARGLTQLMPRVAKWLVPGTTTSDLFDRRVNLQIGFRYLTQLIEKYDGDLKLALLAYNRGPGTVDRVLAKGGNPDNGYADKVIRG